MNSESPEASSQGQPPSDPQKVHPQDTPATATEPSAQPPAADAPAASDAAPDVAPPRGKDAPPAETSAAPGTSEAGADSPAAPAAKDGGTAAERPPALRGKIQIGSRRENSDTARKPARPQMAGAAKPIAVEPAPARKVPVKPPSVREPLSDDLEQELRAALGDASLDELMSGSSTGEDAAVLEMETRHQGTVVRIHNDNVFFALDGRNEGVASLRQFDTPPEPGMQLDVVVRTFSAEDGLYELGVPGASISVDDWSDLNEGALVEARVTGSNTGGLECMVNTIRAFIPASQVAMYRIENFAEFIDQKLLCVVTEVNPDRKNLVLSRRAVLEREREEERQKLMESLAVGQVCEGVVRNIRDFGAFVDIGGVDGLVHISQLSWDRVNHPSEVLQEGQKVQVKIEKIDPQNGKIGLSYRELMEHPWTSVHDQIAADSVVTGKVSRVAKFGAFVKLAPGIEGLVHISELSHSRVPSVGSVVSEGDEVQVKVLSIDTENQRIALSMKAVLPDLPQEELAAPEGEEGPPRVSAVPKRNSPLKGGMDRGSGGDQFGLKW